MLLPDSIHPEQTIYFNGAMVLQTLHLQTPEREHSLDLLELFGNTRARLDISLPVFILCLDWLYLLNLVSVDEEGRIRLCS